MSLLDSANEGAVTVSPDVCTEAAAQLMRERGVSCLVVLEGRKPVGVLTARDIVRRVVGRCLNPKEIGVRKAMTSPVVSMRYGLSLADALEAMRRAGVKHLPLVDDDGNLCGFFTFYTVVNLLGSGFRAVASVAEHERAVSTPE